MADNSKRNSFPPLRDVPGQCHIAGYRTHPCCERPSISQTSSPFSQLPAHIRQKGPDRQDTGWASSHSAQRSRAFRYDDTIQAKEPFRARSNQRPEQVVGYCYQRAIRRTAGAGDYERRGAVDHIDHHSRCLPRVGFEERGTSFRPNQSHGSHDRQVVAVCPMRDTVPFQDRSG